MLENRLMGILKLNYMEEGLGMKRLYYNGTILTMEDETPVVEAVVEENGKITFAGNYADLAESKDELEKVDLKGMTMMPAFIDSHSHFSATANSNLQVSLDGTQSFGEIADRIKTFIVERGVEEGTWINAKGYDHNSLKEGRHPDRAFLDSCCPMNPVVIQNSSGHMGVFNSKGLELLGIDENTKAPEGGLIEIEDGELTGYIEENAFVEYLRKVPMPGIEEFLNAYSKAQDYYASYGITTIQEGLMVAEMVPFYEEMLRENLLKLDVVGYSDVKDLDAIMNVFSSSIGKYDRGFKLGGYKIFLDGSPQARTAWMREPYNGESDYCGYGTMTDGDVEYAIGLALEKKIQLLAHCNGDRAIAQYMDIIKKLRINKSTDDIRPVIIHSQLIGIDQLELVKELNLIPSFFIGHVYYWGDVHIENFGEDRASRISPAKSSLERGIRFTFHQDTPVTAPDMLETVWCAVNRMTKGGKKLCQDERIDILSALKAVTVNSAYQYFEEDRKGSIGLGKNADFVILDRNPLEVDSMDIREIKVLETIKDGNTVYRRQS